ncbi:DNA (cytosine-5-)-methyltransferase [Aquibium carbonis]|uniref:DNA (cytosine-5-)-methyltransferase n=1 Tax=Aquibium carbonis TaxID=2495581 RepID=A0A429YVM1_9HYPH|nr:DNA (cytosine-5-)-methyltransferase [Aquibium carbonis]RST85503.1 DNA (cytosine-5-)-methyltransferase [Aquibium carbonis]
MTFDETVSDTATELMSASVLPNADIVSSRLGLMSKRIKALQKKVTDAITEIAAEIDQVREHVPDTRLRRFLVSECAMNRSDVGTYFRFTEALGDRVNDLVRLRVPFAVIKSLVSADDSVRAEALDRIASGASVHTRDIAAIRKRFAARAADPEQQRERRRRKALLAASERLAVSRLDAFKEEFLPFAWELVHFYNGEQTQDSPQTVDEWLADTGARLQASAGLCRDRFAATFDVSGLPDPWLYDYHGIPEDSVRLARAYDSLNCLAEGRFQAWDDQFDRPLDTDHDYLDLSLVESIVWLFEEVDVPAKRPKTAGHAVPAVPLKTKPPFRLRSLEICAGAGGEALGLHAAGFDALGIYERDRNAVRALDSNYPLGITHQADIREVDFSGYRGKVDLVAGGVPCQGHSSIGKQKGRHDERDLFLEAVRIVEETRPRAFFFENVKGFTFEANAGYRAELHDRFASLGYDSKVFNLRGTDFGLAQGRPRVAFVGFRDGLMSRFRMPPAIVDRPATVGEVLYDLVAANGWEGARRWADETANEVGPTVVGAYDSGGYAFTSKLQLPAWDELGIDTTRLAEEAPGPGHSGKVPMTLKMGARLQGFPDTWKFHGAMGHRKRQIANALPPVMARAVGLAIFSALTDVQFDFAAALRLPLYEGSPGPLRLGRFRGHVFDEEEAH